MSNFKLFPEWAPHEATWIGWPHNKSDWPGKFSPIPYVYAEIVKYISRGEKVRVLVHSKEHKLKAEKVLKQCDVSLSNVEFLVKKTDRGWLRDSSPMFVKESNETHGQNTMTINWMIKFLLSFQINLSSKELLPNMMESR
jgi:agmatine deiminase